MTGSDDLLALISLCVALALLVYLGVRLWHRQTTPDVPRRVERLRAPRRYVTEEPPVDPRLKAARERCPTYDPLARIKAKHEKEKTNLETAPIPMPRPEGVGLLILTTPHGTLLWQKLPEPCRVAWGRVEGAQLQGDDLKNVIDLLALPTKLYRAPLPSEEPEGSDVFSVVATQDRGTPSLTHWEPMAKRWVSEPLETTADFEALVVDVMRLAETLPSGSSLGVQVLKDGTHQWVVRTR